MNAIIQSPMLDEWQTTVATTESSMLRTILPILRNLHNEVAAKVAFIEMILDAETWRPPLEWTYSTSTPLPDGTSSSLEPSSSS